MVVLFDPDARPATRSSAKSSSNASPVPTLPVLGSIAAGRPIEAIEDREEIELTSLIPCDDAHYLLRVKGKSMIDDHIDHGDLVIVERRETAKNGEIVVAIVNDDEATLKRFFRDGSRIRLQPANTEMEPIYPDNCEIRGIVKGVVRRFR